MSTLHHGNRVHFSHRAHTSTALVWRGESHQRYREVEMQNSATCIMTRTSHISHITPVLRTLGWLPHRKAHNQQEAPPYIQGHRSSCAHISHQAPPYQCTHPFSRNLHAAHPPTCTPGYRGVKSLQWLSPPTTGILCLVTSNTPLPLPLPNLTWKSIYSGEPTTT